MGEKAQDNAYAERINRTIKEEYLSHWNIKTFKQLKRYVTRAVKNYNQVRPHNNIGRKSPMDFEILNQKMKEKDRKTITIFNDQVLT